MHQPGNMHISVVIPTWRRTDQLIKTLTRINECTPPPAELLIHVDSGDTETANIVRNRFPEVKIFESATRQGPGGGRNILIRAAENEIVASFDDDSYPIDKDYFSRLVSIFDNYPDASAVASVIVHRNEPVPDATRKISTATAFVNCGSAICKQDFIETGGYVVLPLSYGMEETDLALRLMASGKKIYFCPWLRTFHDTDLTHHASPEINAAAIANIALLAFLRYPLVYLPYGVLQVLNRVIWCVKAGRFKGIFSGLTGIPCYLWRFKNTRSPIPVNIFHNVLRLMRKSIGKKQEPIVIKS